MSYQIRRPATEFTIDLRNFHQACKWLVQNAEAIGGGEFEIWRVEKRGRRVTEEREALFTSE